MLPKINNTAQKMKFSIMDFFGTCDKIRRESADLVTFTEEIPNGKLHFLCSNTILFQMGSLEIFV